MDKDYINYQGLDPYSTGILDRQYFAWYAKKHFMF